MQYFICIMVYIIIYIIGPWYQTNLVLNSADKVKPGFLLSLMCMFPESNGIKLWSYSFHLQNSGILQTRIDQRGNPMKINFDILQILKWILQTNEKNGVICLVSFFSFLSYGPQIVKNSLFFANLCWRQEEI